MNAAAVLQHERSLAAELASLVDEQAACTWCDFGRSAGRVRVCTQPDCTAGGPPVPVRFVRGPSGRCGPGAELMRVEAWGL